MADIHTPPPTWTCQLCHETILFGAHHECNAVGEVREWHVLQFRDGHDGMWWRSLGTARATTEKAARTLATHGHDTSETVAFCADDLRHGKRPFLTGDE